MAELPLCEDLENETLAAAWPAGTCHFCPEGQYVFSFDEPCRDCPGSTGRHVQRFSAAGFCALGLLLIWGQASAREERKLRVGRAAAEVVALVVPHMQLLAILLALPWSYPRALITVLELPASFLGLDLPTMFGINCIDAPDGGLWWRWMASQGGFLSVLTFMVLSSFLMQAMERHSIADRCIHNAMVVFALMYTTILRGAAAMHDCVRHGEALVMDHTPEVACEFWFGYWVSGMVLTGFLLIPAIMLCDMHSKHGKLGAGGISTPKNIARQGWLFMRYRDQVYWWEVWVLYKSAVSCSADLPLPVLCS